MLPILLILFRTVRASLLLLHMGQKFASHVISRFQCTTGLSHDVPCLSPSITCAADRHVVINLHRNPIYTDFRSSYTQKQIFNMSEACCTCAALLSSIPPTYDEKTEKPTQYERRLECCGRAICARCITDNPRFASYCPFCQISTVPTPLPQGLRDPPAYSPPGDSNETDEPPPYSAHNQAPPLPEKSKDGPVESAPDVLHFIDPNNDSILSLSLRYGVPADALRRTNGLYADQLLAARRTLLIPGEYYKGGVSLSPRPLEGEEEEIRKGKVRKFMVGCKVAE